MGCESDGPAASFRPRSAATQCAHHVLSATTNLLAVIIGWLYLIAGCGPEILEINSEREAGEREGRREREELATRGPVAPNRKNKDPGQSTATN